MKQHLAYIGLALLGMLSLLTSILVLGGGEGYGTYFPIGIASILSSLILWLGGVEVNEGKKILSWVSLVILSAGLIYSLFLVLKEKGESVSYFWAYAPHFLFLILMPFCLVLSVTIFTLFKSMWLRLRKPGHLKS